MREVVLEVPQIPFAGVEPGDIIYSGTRAVPIIGDEVDTTGERRLMDVANTWEERPLTVVEVEGGLSPDAPLTLRCIDLRDQMCDLWWPMISKLGVDPNDNGIAYLGSTRTASRNQTGYSRRADGLYTDRAAGTTASGLRYGSYIFKGLHIDGGSERVLKNNTFSQWSGGLPTSWTVSGVTVSQETTEYLIDVSGLRSSVKIVTNPAGDYVFVRQQSTTWTAAHFGRVRLTFECLEAAAPINVQVLRASDGKAYNFTSGAWEAAMWNDPLAVGTLLDYDTTLSLAGQILEWVSPVFTVGGNDSVDLLVGYPSGASKTSIVHRADLIRSSYASCPGWALVPTVGAAVTAIADSVYVSNSTAERFLLEERGTIEFRWRPSVHHADLADAGIQRLYMSYRQGVAVTDEYDGIWYMRDDATHGRWVFQREIGGTPTSAEYAVTGADLLVAGTEYIIAARWIGPHRELGKEPDTMDLFVDGALRATSVSGVPGAATNDGVVCIGRDAGGADGDFGAGWYSRLTCQSFCKTDAEILAGMVI